MQDLQQTLTLVLDYIKGIWIKKRYVIISSWLICPIGFLYVANLPDQYRSTAKVFVDTRSVLQPMLRGLALETNAYQEVQIMARTLLSRDNVEQIARNSDLDISANSDAAFNNIVTGLQNSIKLNSTGRNNIFNISFPHNNPAIAQRVVQSTLDLFVEGSLGSNRKGSDTADRFINEQIAEYENRLTEAEQRLADFKRQYNDILPQQGSYFANLSALNEQKESIQLEIKQVNQQIASLKGKLTSNSMNDSFSVTNGEEIVLNTRYDERIRSLEDKLDQLKLRFTNLHPDVIETANLLKNLEEARQQEINAFKDANLDDAGLPTNELGREISLEVSRLESNVASLQVKEQDILRKIEDLESKIDLIPQIEAESTALNRDYGINKRKYEELLSRRESADLARRADASTEKLQFRIIEPPNLPTKPTGPNRFMMYTGILLAGFGVGVAIAFILSQLNPILIRPKQIQSIIDYPILGAVSHFDIEKIKKRDRVRMIIFAMSSSLVMGLYAVCIIADKMNIDLLAGIL